MEGKIFIETPVGLGCIKIPEPPVGYLVHEATHSQIAIYENINWLQRFCIRVCFGLKYVKYK